MAHDPLESSPARRFTVMVAAIFLIVAALLLLSVQSILKGELGTAFVLALVPIGGGLFLFDLDRVAKQKVHSFIIPLIFVVGQYLTTWQVAGKSVLPMPLLLAFVAPALFVVYYSVSAPDERAAFWARFHPLKAQAIFFLVAVFMSQLLSDSLRMFLSPFSFIYFLGAFGFFLLALFYCDSMYAVRNMMLFLVLGAFLQLPLALEEMGLLGIPILHRLFGLTILVPGFVTGSLLDGELFAEYMVILAVWGIALAWSARNGIARIATMLLALSYIVAGSLTIYRSFLLGLAGAFLLFFALILFRSRATRFRFRYMVSLLALGLLVGSFSGYVMTSEFGGSALERMSSLELTGEYAFNRAPVYSAVLRFLPEIPLTGLGVNHLTLLSNALGYSVLSAHSLPLWAFLSCGWPGLVATLVLFLSVLILAFRAHLGLGSDPFVALDRPGRMSSALLATFLFFCVDQLKIDYVRGSIYGYFVWIFVALVCSLSVLERRQICER